MKKLLTALLLAVFLLTACAPPAAPTDSQPASAAGSGASDTSGEKVVTMAVSSTWETLMPFNTSSN